MRELRTIGSIYDHRRAPATIGNLLLKPEYRGIMRHRGSHRYRSLGWIGGGTLTPGLDSAAHALYSALGTSVSPESNPTVAAFQRAYNAAGFTPALLVDGEYGPLTSAALQSTLNLSADSPTLTAPPGFEYGTGTRVSDATITVPTTTITGSASSPWPWILGGGAAVVVAVAVARAMKKRPRRARYHRPAHALLMF